MPRKKSYSLVTVTRAGDDIIAVDVAEDLDTEQLAARLTALPPPNATTVERRVFAGSEIEWTPSVRLGAPAKRKPPAEKKPRKPREEKTNGTRFEPDGAKSAGQGEKHGA